MKSILLFVSLFICLISFNQGSKSQVYKHYNHEYINDKDFIFVSEENCKQSIYIKNNLNKAQSFKFIVYFNSKIVYRSDLIQLCPDNDFVLKNVIEWCVLDKVRIIVHSYY